VEGFPEQWFRGLGCGRIPWEVPLRFAPAALRAELSGAPLRVGVVKYVLCGSGGWGVEGFHGQCRFASLRRPSGFYPGHRYYGMWLSMSGGGYVGGGVVLSIYDESTHK